MELLSRIVQGKLEGPIFLRTIHPDLLDYISTISKGWVIQDTDNKVEHVITLNDVSADNHLEFKMSFGWDKYDYAEHLASNRLILFFDPIEFSKFFLALESSPDAESFLKVLQGDSGKAERITIADFEID